MNWVTWLVVWLMIIAIFLIGLAAWDIGLEPNGDPPQIDVGGEDGLYFTFDPVDYKPSDARWIAPDTIMTEGVPYIMEQVRVVYPNDNPLLLSTVEYHIKFTRVEEAAPCKP